MRLEELLNRREWFADPARPVDAAPHVVTVDDFYADPHKVRELALKLQFVRYLPPDERIVGTELAARNAHRRGPWMTSAFVTYHGTIAEKPFYGERYNPPQVREALERLIGEKVREETWLTGGDYWNGAFHLLEEGFRVGDGVIHHHYKPGDVEERGWSGVVYLSPDAPASSGTSFWRERESGRCVASFGAEFQLDTRGFELVHTAENRFNRLVLFRENVWHRVEHGFARGAEARLTQTFFFETDTDQAVEGFRPRKARRTAAPAR